MTKSFTLKAEQEAFSKEEVKVEVSRPVVDVVSLTEIENKITGKNEAIARLQAEIVELEAEKVEIDKEAAKHTLAVKEVVVEAPVEEVVEEIIE